MDIMYLSGKSLLKVVDVETIFQNAIFINGKNKSETME